MATLTAQQANELAGDFLGLAQAIGDYRYSNWKILEKSENDRLGNMQWSIMNYGEDILAISTGLVMGDVQASLSKINGITVLIKETISEVKKIQKAIDVAGAIVTLGAAIISKHPQSILDAMDGVVHTWNT